MKPGKEVDLLPPPNQALGTGSVAGDEYLRNMTDARLLTDGRIQWVENHYSICVKYPGGRIARRNGRSHDGRIQLHPLFKPRTGSRRFTPTANRTGDRLLPARGWKLDDTLTLRDLGVSAFRGMNATVGHLRVFLDAIKSGRVTAGSALIVESIDRISRQGIDEGYDIISCILKSNVLIVTLSPEREYDVSATKRLSQGALEIQLILERPRKASASPTASAPRGHASRSTPTRRP